jgi:diaminopimelate decarboxylase
MTSKINLTESLVRSYGSPLYIFHKALYAANFGAYAEFTNNKKGVAFPVKANPMLEVLAYHAQLGGSADCASKLEYQLAKLAGFENGSIIYNSPQPEVSLCKQLLVTGATVVIDSVHMFNALADEADNVTGRVFIRIHPELDVSYTHKKAYQSLTNHAASHSKFGILPNDLFKLLPSNKLPISGLHLHIGTQMDNLESFANAMAYLHELAEIINRYPNCKIKFIDIGGGLGIKFREMEQMPSISEFVALLKPLRKNKFEYLVEPGHSLVGSTMELATRVTDVKNMGGKRWAICDVGTNQLAKVTLLNWPHEIESKYGVLADDGPDAVGGPLCFNGDTLLHQTDLGNLKQGDVLSIKNVGAYCYSLSNYFNGKTIAGAVSINADGVATQFMRADTLINNPTVLAYTWPMQEWQQPKAETIAPERFLALSSVYLHQQITEDAYQIEEVKRLNESQYEFTVALRSAVDFVSGPFLLRTVGDCIIVAVLHASGESEKRKSVLGDNMLLKISENMKSNSRHKFWISLSGIIDRNHNQQQRIAHCTIENSKNEVTINVLY